MVGSSSSCHLGSEKSGKKTNRQKHMKATTEAALSSGSFELGQEEVSLCLSNTGALKTAASQDG